MFTQQISINLNLFKKGKQLAALKNTAVLFVTVFFLFGCGDYQGQTSSPQKISFEPTKISEKEGDCDGQNSDYCAEITIEYPIFSIPDKREIEKKINNFVKNEMLVSFFSEDKIDSFDELRLMEICCVNIKKCDLLITLKKLE